MTRPVLASPNLDKEFRVEADASNYATGGVLSMKCSNELWKLVAFISKSLSNTERNYEIVRDVRSGSGVTQNGAELPRNERDLITKVGEQPWPQLMRCASIDCRACGCVFQEN